MEPSNTTKSSWYDNSTYLILACILLFPVGLYGIWKSKNVPIWAQLGYTGLLAYLLLGNPFSEKKPAGIKVTYTNQEVIEDSIDKPEPKPPIDRMAKLREEIQTELDVLTSGYTPTARTKKEQIFLELSRFALWGKLINKGEKSDDKEAMKLAKRLATKLIQLQQREFPKLRKSYVNSIEHDLWRENIRISTKGSRNTTLELVGGTFASNRNIESYQTAFSSVVKSLRFKRVNYKWIRNDSEYTYYTISSDPDGEIKTSL